MPLPEMEPALSREEPDLAEIRGQENAKRALEVALAGGHHEEQVRETGGTQRLWKSFTYW